VTLTTNTDTGRVRMRLSLDSLNVETHSAITDNREKLETILRKVSEGIEELVLEHVRGKVP
jgi:hypothetical protein